MDSAATTLQTTNDQKPSLSADVEDELWDIHQGYSGIMGMLRMVKQYAESDPSESQTAADVAEVLDQYIPTVDVLRSRLDAAICSLKYPI